jgi:hypothetical protein
MSIPRILRSNSMSIRTTSYGRNKLSLSITRRNSKVEHVAS